MPTPVFKDIDEYIASFPKDIQKPLQILRRTIKQAAPAATETIKYGMPTFVLGKNLVYFAAWKKHIGFYGAYSTFTPMKTELAPYTIVKDTLQFSYDEPLPLELITKIVKFRVKENTK